MNKQAKDDLISSWGKDEFYIYKSEENADKRQEKLKNLIKTYSHHAGKFSFFEDKYKTLEEFKNSKEYDDLDIIYKHLGELVANSIFSLYQIISVINICGVSYMLSYSYLGHFHRKLGKWLKYYTLLRILHKFNYIKFDIKTELSKIIGADSITTLDSTSQFQLAAQNYRKAIQLHSQGESYHRQIGNMIYLEDDYNDNLYHYCAAIERQQINSGRINAYLKEIEEITEKSQMLRIQNYL